MTFRKRRESRRISRAELAALEREVLSDDTIERLDRELGNPTGAKDPDWRPGPPLLSAPLARLHSALDDPAGLEFRPGFRWPVVDATSVQFLSGSAVSPNFVQVVHPPKSKVVLPDSVQV